MKKFLLSVFCLGSLMSAQVAQAQNFTTPYDTVRATYNGSILELHNNITNISSSPIKITWNVIYTNFPSSWTTATALGICDNAVCQQNANNQLTNGTTFTSLDYNPNVLGDFHLLLDLTNSTPNQTPYYITIALKNGSQTKNITFQVGKYATNVPSVSKSDDDVVVYPNPTRGNLFVNYSGAETVKTIAVYNVIGKMVSSFRAAGNNVQLDVENIPAGVYYVRLMDAQGAVIATRRFTHQ